MNYIDITFKDYTKPVYYFFLYSKKSFVYQTFSTEEELMNEINKEHSRINIIQFVLKKIEEDYTFTYGLIDDSIFENINNIAINTFNKQKLFARTRQDTTLSEESMKIFNRNN